MKEWTTTIEIPGIEGSVEVKVKSMHKSLLGRDQPTAERVQGAQTDSWPSVRDHSHGRRWHAKSQLPNCMEENVAEF